MNPILNAWRVYARQLIDGQLFTIFIGAAIGTDTASAIAWVRETHPERTSKLSDVDLVAVPLRTEILQGASEATGPHKPGQVGSTPTPAPNLPPDESTDAEGRALVTPYNAPRRKPHALAARVAGLALVATTAAVGGQLLSPPRAIHEGSPGLSAGVVVCGVGNSLPKPNMGRHAIGPATSGRDATLWRESVGWQPEPGAGSRVAGCALSRPERLGYLSGTRRGSGPAHAGKFNAGARLKAVSAGQMLNEIACDMIARAVRGNNATVSARPGDKPNAGSETGERVANPIGSSSDGYSGVDESRLSDRSSGMLGKLSVGIAAAIAVAAIAVVTAAGTLEDAP